MILTMDFDINVNVCLPPLGENGPAERETFNFNPYLTNGLSQPYHLDESTSIFSEIRRMFFVFVFDEIPVSKQCSPT